MVAKKAVKKVAVRRKGSQVKVAIEQLKPSELPPVLFASGQSQLADELRQAGIDVAKRHARDEELRVNNAMTQALAIIYGDREKTYGRPSVNLESIAQMWTVYLQRTSAVRGTDNLVTIDDVCQMMVLLKMARLINDPRHHDSQVDQIGYIGLQERVQAE